MKKISYLFLLVLAIGFTSCMTTVKIIARSATKRWDNHTDVNFSGMQLIDSKGQRQSFADRFNGKVVYVHTWTEILKAPATEKNEDYAALKKRFKKYDDVAFVYLYMGTDTASAHREANKLNIAGDTYQLVQDDASKAFYPMVGKEPAPMLIGKNGTLLGYYGPHIEDRIIVDYAICKARDGINATKAAKEVINATEMSKVSKNQALNTWYTSHFNKPANKSFGFSVSSNGKQDEK